jgi:nitrate reductase gamma subunit
MFQKLFAPLLSIWALMLGFSIQAQAAVPTEVTTALTDAKADAISVAGTVFGIIIAIAAFLYMRRATR